jgi:hypothetical protein
MADIKNQHVTTSSAADFWTDETSVLFTSFWDWSPETWGTVGWTNHKGKARRDNLLQQLTDPFITVVYITNSSKDADPELKGMIVGFYLISHEQGDRDEFTHPIHHKLTPKKWRHSLRALRAFSYLPEYRLNAYEFDPSLTRGGINVASLGKVLTDTAQITLLRETPWVEVDVYTVDRYGAEDYDDFSSTGKVKGGPASKRGYVVSEGTHHLPRQLYILRLKGDSDAFLGESANGRAIYKIGLSISPDLRRQALQKAMPRGAFHWRIDRTSKTSGFESTSFDAAMSGENAMKTYLAECACHLGGEFYLASKSQIDEAWRRGHAGIAK